MNGSGTQNLEQRLDEFGEHLRRSGSVADQVMRQVGEDAASPHRSLRRKMMAAVLAAAAVLVMAATLWLALGHTAAPAYGVEGAAKRLLNVDSIHLLGQHTVYREDGTQAVIPMEYYLAPPHRYLSTHMGIYPDKVTTSRKLVDGKHYLIIDDSERTALRGTQPLLQSELEAAASFQRFTRQLGLTGSTAGDLKKTGQANTLGIHCDLYEAHSRDEDGNNSVTRLWLNPQTGLPVRYQHESRDDDGEGSAQEWDRIVVNGPPPAQLSQMQPPAGYQTTERNIETLTFGMGGAGMSNDKHRFTLALGQVLNIDDAAIFACWAYYDSAPQPPHEPLLADRTPRTLDDKLPASSAKAAYRQIVLRQDRTPEGWHWQWMLLLPDRQGLDITAHPPELRVRGPGHDFTMHLTPLMFRDDRLAPIVQDIQRVTLPPDADPATLLTLEDLRRRITAAQN